MNTLTNIILYQEKTSKGGVFAGCVSAIHDTETAAVVALNANCDSFF